MMAALNLSAESTLTLVILRRFVNQPLLAVFLPKNAIPTGGFDLRRNV